MEDEGLETTRKVDLCLEMNCYQSLFDDYDDDDDDDDLFQSCIGRRMTAHE